MNKLVQRRLGDQATGHSFVLRVVHGVQATAMLTLLLIGLRQRWADGGVASGPEALVVHIGAGVVVFALSTWALVLRCRAGGWRDIAVGATRDQTHSSHAARGLQVCVVFGLYVLPTALALSGTAYLWHLQSLPALPLLEAARLSPQPGFALWAYVAHIGCGLLLVAMVVWHLAYVAYLEFARRRDVLSRIF